MKLSAVAVDQASEASVEEKPGNQGFDLFASNPEAVLRPSLEDANLSLPKTKFGEDVVLLLRKVLDDQVEVESELFLLRAGHAAVLHVGGLD